MASPNVTELNEANFDEQVLKSSVPVVVDFWATWCQPCLTLAPTLEQLAVEYAGKVKIGKVNIEDAQALAAQYRINSIPTLLFFKNGKSVGQVVGVKSKKELKEQIDQLGAVPG